MSNENGCVLGIDLGASSLGTALIDWSEHRVVFTGARIFKAGVDNLDVSNKEASRAATRGQARMQRRQTDRRRRRLQNVFRILQRAALLPNGNREAAYFARLDRDLVDKFGNPEKLPYVIRAAALDRPLEPFEFGRALFHLAQRRGFKSNKKQRASDEKSTGVVNSGIAELSARMNEVHARTLGEFFAKHLDPKLDHRIRTLYTHRDWYREEFEKIWNAQAAFGAAHCTPELFAKLQHAIYHQRPLKPQTSRIGRCFLETSQRRAPVALLEVQRFRLRKSISDLRIWDGSGLAAPLTPDQRQIVFDYCASTDTPKTADAKKALGLPKTAKFTLEAGGQSKLPGLRTHREMQSKLGRTWSDLTPADQSALVAFLVTSPQTIEEQRESLVASFGLDEPSAKAALNATFADGYFSLSLAAIEKLTPLVEQGWNDTAAILEVYGDVKRCEPVDLLPPLNDERVKNLLGDVSNPIVIRALTEMRKTVNAIIRRFGKPAAIHIELARDVRKSYEERMRLQKRIYDQEKKRNEARETIAQCTGMPADAVRPYEIEKYLLAAECGFECPYSGRPISCESLFGQHALFHVEHIIPKSWSLDDSFANKTLCYHEYNALKSNQTPWQAFGSTDDWDNIIARVKKWPERNRAKLERFLLTETDHDKILSEFSSRQLNDTRYASRLAAIYLGMLFGGKTDPDGRQRVLTCSGPVTAQLRRTWDLNRILNEEPVKSRDDHRHHAVDAAAVALCSQGMIQRYSRAVSSAAASGKPRKIEFPEPWPGFRDQLKQAVLSTQVSKRPEYKLQAAMHDEFHYSAPKGKSVHIRKAVNKDLNPAEIVDRRIREAVEAKIAELGGKSKLGVDGNWPMLLQRGGKQMPIKRVRIRKSETPTRLPSSGGYRWVLAKKIHHTAIILDESGKKSQYDYKSVSVLDALARHAEGKDIVQREYGERRTLICTLRAGDVIEYQVEGLPFTHWLVRTVGRDGEMELNPLSDARLKAAIKASPDKVFQRPKVSRAFSNGARKISLSLLGEAFYSHD